MTDRARLTRASLLAAAGVGAGAAIVRATEASGAARNPLPRVSFTWDGPLSTVHSKAMPMLAKHGFVGTVYAVTHRVGGTRPEVPWDRYCTWQELHELAAAGWEVSNHTRTHPHHMGRVSRAVAEYEVVGAKQDLVARGFATPGFAYPYSSYGPMLVDIVAAQHAYARAGAELGTTVSPIRSRAELYEMQTQVMPAMPADQLEPFTRAAIGRGQSVVWLAHVVGPPLKDLSIDPGVLERYLAFVAGEQRAGRLRVSTAYETAQANLLV
jgi:peptidoglycan/xylan/chitin deacetylase (PgdA/CDA1 family)